VTDAAAKRRALARRVTDQLAAHTALKATLLTGSVAAGTCDDRSDIDLLNYYDELPARAEFDRLLGELGARLTRELSPPGAAEFVASYELDGIEAQTGAGLASTLEATLARIEGGEVDWATAKVAMGLQEGLAMHGADVVARWQARLAYPESLRRREIETNLGFFPIWRLREYLSTRDAALFERQMLLDGAFRVAAILSALNGLYFSSFQFKRMSDHAARMTRKPERLGERLAAVADAPAEAAGRELEALVGETTELVRAALPDIDVDRAWRPPVEAG
jgi:predicted nucleotidyltransferase